METITYSSKATAKRAAIREVAKTKELSKEQVAASFDEYATIGNGEGGEFIWTPVVEEVEVSDEKPEIKRASTCKRPTLRVWDIADEMKGSRRKDIITACVEAGVAYNTARTQYQLWYSSLKNS